MATIHTKDKEDDNGNVNTVDVLLPILYCANHLKEGDEDNEDGG